MRVLISGAGIAGLTLAWLLERDGHEVVMVERAPALRTEGYMMDFFGAGYDACEKLGWLDDLAAIHYPIPHLTFLDGHGREQVAVPYAEFRRLFDGRHFNFMRGDLERLLHAKVEGRVEIRFGTSIDACFERDDGVTVSCSDGGPLHGDLLVGADGIHSRVRELTFGPEHEYLIPLGYDAAAFILDQPPRGFAHTDAFSMLGVPDRQVAVYPIRGGRLATFFIHRTGRPPLPVDEAEASRQLRTVYGDLHWIVPDLLAARPAGSVYYDTVAQIRLPTWSTRARRIVLLGDACQCLSVVAGQGASMAMAAAYVLADELRIAPDVPGALARYEHRVKPDIETKQEAGRRMARWFVPDSPFRMTVRTLVLRAVRWRAVQGLMRRLFAAEGSLRL